MSLKILDLFAGAGGFSEGFYLNDCDLVAHIEMDKDACDTLITRAIYYSLKKKGQIKFYDKYIAGEITRDEIVKRFDLQKEVDSVILSEIGEKNYKNLIEQVKKKLEGNDLDIIIGGPPCQAYSMIGRARDVNGMKKDKRNFLYKYYVEFLIGLRPKVFVFENVPGLKTAGGGKYLKDMRILMQKAGYETDFQILNASDYGVPQNRKRVILVGWRKETGIKEYPKFEKVLREYKVKDFLDDLPIIGPNNTVRKMDYKNKSKFLTEIGIRDQNTSYVTDHVTRPNTKQDLSIYKIALETYEMGKTFKYNTLPERLITHKNTKAFLDRFKVVDANAFASQTVVAHISKDGHYYIHPDKKQLRSLSVREAARLQTFPDSYRFEGSRTAQFRQIGNAVPPMLAINIANKLIEHLKPTNKGKTKQNINERKESKHKKSIQTKGKTLARVG